MVRAGAAFEMLRDRGKRKLCARVSEGVETVYARKMKWVWRPRERGRRRRRGEREGGKEGSVLPAALGTEAKVFEEA